jgi:hypothetical protein
MCQLGDAVSKDCIDPADDKCNTQVSLESTQFYSVVWWYGMATTTTTTVMVLPPALKNALGLVAKKRLTSHITVRCHVTRTHTPHKENLLRQQLNFEHS